MNTTVLLWREHRALLGRWLARLSREPLAMFGTVARPVLWLLLFGNLLSRMAQDAAITAGAVVMTIFNAGIMGGVELLFDRETVCSCASSPHPCTVSRWSPADSHTSPD